MPSLSWVLNKYYHCNYHCHYCLEHRLANCCPQVKSSLPDLYGIQAKNCVCMLKRF